MTTAVLSPVIRWQLRQIMADRRMTNTALAEILGISRQAIGDMKNRDDMPRIDGQTLNSLCNALDCQPTDLIKYEAD